MRASAWTVLKFVSTVSLGWLLIVSLSSYFSHRDNALYPNTLVWCPDQGTGFGNSVRSIIFAALIARLTGRTFMVGDAASLTRYFRLKQNGQDTPAIHWCPSLAHLSRSTLEASLAAGEHILSAPVLSSDLGLVWATGTSLASSLYEFDETKTRVQAAYGTSSQLAVSRIIMEELFGETTPEFDMRYSEFLRATGIEKGGGACCVVQLRMWVDDPSNVHAALSEVVRNASRVARSVFGFGGDDDENNNVQENHATYGNGDGDCRNSVGNGVGKGKSKDENKDHGIDHDNDIDNGNDNEHDRSDNKRNPICEQIYLTSDDPHALPRVITAFQSWSGATPLITAPADNLGHTTSARNQFAGAMLDWRLMSDDQTSAALVCSGTSFCRAAALLRTDPALVPVRMVNELFEADFVASFVDRFLCY